MADIDKANPGGLMLSDEDSIQLFHDVCDIINDTRNKIAVYVNTTICLTRWKVGTRIKEDVLYNKRADYGKTIIKRLSDMLIREYGSGWGFQTLQHCVRAAYTFRYMNKYERHEWEESPIGLTREGIIITV